MKYPFLASILILCALFYYENKKADKRNRANAKAYWDRELEANSTRKKPLDDVEFIKIPLDTLPCDKALDDNIVSEKVEDIKKLANDDIANFTNLTNTDLKLMYGVANLPYLQQCDMNYTVLVRTLNEWGQRLHELGLDDDALCVLEYAIRCKTDISKTYFLLADIYIQNNEISKAESLLENAESIQSPLKKSILETLNNKLSVS